MSGVLNLDRCFGELYRNSGQSKEFPSTIRTKCLSLLRWKEKEYGRP